MQFSIKDSFRSAIETASGGRNTVMYDEQGNPNIMVCFQKVNCEFFDSDLGTGVHPAFIINGKEVDEIWVGKYKNANVGNTDVSMPGMLPTEPHNKDGVTDMSPITYFTERAKRKGPGWHMITNAEHALVEYWMLKLGSYYGGLATMDSRLTDYGNRVIPYKTGLSAEAESEEQEIKWGSYFKPYGGTSSPLTSHDNTPFGVYDFVGGVWEYVQGFEVYNLRVYFHTQDGVPDNGLGNDLLYKPGSPEWTVGTYFTPDANGKLQVNDLPPTRKYDCWGPTAKDLASKSRLQPTNYMGHYLTRLSIYHPDVELIGDEKVFNSIWYLLNGDTYEESNHFGTARGCRCGDFEGHWTPFSWYSRGCGAWKEPSGCYSSRLVWVSPDKL